MAIFDEIFLSKDDVNSSQWPKLICSTALELEINSTVKATAFQGDGSTLEGIVKKAGDIMTGALTVQNNLTVTGDVGIATSTAPTEKLEVNGNIKANSFLGNGATLDGIVRKTGDTMTGALTIDNNLTVNGAIAPISLSVTTSATIDGNLTVNGKLKIIGEVIARDIEHVPGSLTVDGYIGIGTSSTRPEEALDMGGRSKNIKFVYAHIGETGNGAATIIANKARVSKHLLNRVDYSHANADGVSAIELLYTNGISFFTKPTDSNNPTVVGDQFFSENDRTYERMRISSTGNVGIGTTSNHSYKLYVNGSAAKPGGGSWTNTSDARLKQNVEPLSGILDKLLKLRGVSYEWKNPENHGNLTGKQIGMIAQEVEKVFPKWVGTDSDGYKDLTFRGFEALTVEAFRELKLENEILNLKYKELKARTESLEELIKREKDIALDKS